MNFQSFQKLYKRADFDEIKVLGKEIEKEGKRYHVMGMTLKEKTVRLYVLEEKEFSEEMKTWKECTPRESMKHSMKSEKTGSFFMHIREFRNGDSIYETAGAISGVIEQGDYSESYLLFMKMQEAGWKMEQESYFYQVPWNRIVITNLELRGEFETLPPWDENMEILVDNIPESGEVEVPIVLECGKTQKIEFSFKDGSKAFCYIEKTDILDVWKELEEQFADEKYRQRMLEYMTEEELMQSKRNCFEALEQQCPKGKCFMAIEYECNQDVSLNFYAKEYLDTVPKPQKGSCSAIFMTHRPEKEIGQYGGKLRGCVIQQPLEKGTKKIEAELFSYTQIKKTRNMTL